MCDCKAKVNEKLKGWNTKLSETFCISSDLDVTGTALLVETEKLDSKVRGKPRRMAATFCPFCGQKPGATEPGGLTECDMGDSYE